MTLCHHVLKSFGAILPKRHFHSALEIFKRKCFRSGKTSGKRDHSRFGRNLENFSNDGSRHALHSNGEGILLFREKSAEADLDLFLLRTDTFSRTVMWFMTLLTSK